MGSYCTPPNKITPTFHYYYRILVLVAIIHNMMVRSKDSLVAAATKEKIVNNTQHINIPLVDDGMILKQQLPIIIRYTILYDDNNINSLLRHLRMASCIGCYVDVIFGCFWLLYHLVCIFSGVYKLSIISQSQQTLCKMICQCHPYCHLVRYLSLNKLNLIQRQKTHN